MNAAVQEVVQESLRRDLPRPLPRLLVIKRMPGKVSVLVGMRRTGKTWLCFQRMQELLASGVPRECLLYLNFEDDRLSGLTLGDLKWVTECFYALYPENRKKPCYLFFDEIQLVEGWERFIRRLLDTERVDITVTGSSAKMLSLEIGTSLRGRGLTTEVFPLDFREFCTFTGITLPKGAMGADMRSTLQKAAMQYLEVGGFPEVQGQPVALQRDILQEYVSSVILRDVIERHGVTNVAALRAMVRQILRNPAAPLSLTKFTGHLKALGIPIAKNSLLDYLDHLHDAYLCFPVEIHDRSVRRRQVNDRKLYSIDVGLQRAVSLGMTRDQGHFLESLVFLHLRRKGYKPDYFRAREGGYEVDFVIQTPRHGMFVQSCWTLESEEAKEREFRALALAAKEKPDFKQVLVTWMDEGDRAGVRVVPFWKWALE